LEIACPLVLLAGESDLRALFTEEVCDFSVGNFANLVVLAHDLSILITDAAFACLYHCIAGSVLRTDVAVDSCPTLVALAVVTGSHLPVSTFRQRTTD
jgi:hypothetical protein